MAILKAGSIELPAPVSISTADELIWSNTTGRAANGDMAGDVIAEKKTLYIEWGILTETEYALIKKNLAAGFFPVTFHDDGMDMTISAYRGSLSKEHIGKLSDGIYYYRSVTAEIIQK